MAADSDGEPKKGFTNQVITTCHKLGLDRDKQVQQLSGVCEEENDLIQTVFTCHGNLDDPEFPQRFSHLLDQLSSLLSTGKDVLMKRVKKLEPWNSVRVTLTIPREAATRLRALAAAGDAALQALGILSVQVEGDQVISLRLAAPLGGEPQEIVLRTGSGTPTAASPSCSLSPTSSLPAGPVSALLQSIPGTSGTNNSGFRSPNVVAPAGNTVIPPSPRPLTGPSPFPFTSMTHAAQTQQARQESPHHNFAAPPPYAAKPFTPPIQRTVSQTQPSQVGAPSVAPKTSAPVTSAPADTTVSLASPLLVNLLQTDGKDGKEIVRESEPRLRPAAPNKPRPRPVSKPFSPRVAGPRFPMSTQRFPPATSTVLPVPTTSSSPVLRPSLTSLSKETVPPRSVLQGFSQITALSSKSTSSVENSETADERNNTADGKKLIINPLTGELEPMPSESSDSEGEPPKGEPFFPLSSSSSRAYSDDDSMELWSSNRRGDGSDNSESELTSKEMAIRRRVHKAASASSQAQGQGLKLRLLADKPETGAAPVVAYKVDVCFPNRKAINSSGNRSAGSPVVSGSVSPAASSPGTASQGEEPRVPPLHISLRGRNAVVTNKKKPSHWLLDEDDEFYSKLPKKKLKLSSGSVKDGRDSVAITNCDLAQKPKRAKLKRMIGPVDGDGLKLKIPVTPEIGDLCDEKLSKKRKDSKKVKNNFRHPDSDGDTKVSLKMDSEEWISRTLKEETLRNSVSLPSDGESGLSGSGNGGGGGGEVEESLVSERVGAPVVDEIDDAPPAPTDPIRTNTLKLSNLELSELLRCKKLENSSKKLDCLKIKNKLFTDSAEVEASEEQEGEVAAVKKPQEIGGKIKSELSSKIDRVSGKLKNDLSKDGLNKKKLDDPNVKSLKGVVRSKPNKKEIGSARPILPGSVEVEGDEGAFNRTKRRHSGDQSAPESQAQKVKRSSSSDQPGPLCKLPQANRRFDISRKMRKDYLIDRSRKEKLGKVVQLNSKVMPSADSNNKKSHALKGTSSNGAVKVAPETVGTSQVTTVLPALVDVKPVNTRLDGEPEKLKDNTQGEDSGIESMDALSEKSPNQGESPCRKEMDEGKKGQNHDRTEEDEGKEGQDNSCLTMGNSNQETHPPQAHSVPFECSSQNNNSANPEPETSTKLTEPVNDGLIDSFEIKIREAFRREEDPSREGLAAKILEGSSMDWMAKPEIETKSDALPDTPLVVEQTNNSVDVKNVEEPNSVKNSEPEVEPSSETTAEPVKDWAKDGSPSLEDMERFRVNPPLYTYAKREDSLSPSPTTVEGSDLRENDHVKDEDSNSKMSGSQPVKAEDGGDELQNDSAVPARSLRNKSLLEQLLIEIPEDTRRTRSWHKLSSSPGETPKSSPRPSSPSVARPSPRSCSKQSPTPRVSKRPNKRKSSENAAELIKACMGVDEGKGGKTSAANTPVSASGTWKKGDVESSDDEPLSDLARSREQSVEQDSKPNMVKSKMKQIVEEESRNNNKVGMKVATETPTRRSVRQTQGGLSKGLRTPVASTDVRSVRSTRSALCQETGDSGSKRRRTSRDGK